MCSGHEVVMLGGVIGEDENRNALRFDALSSCSRQGAVPSAPH